MRKISRKLIKETVKNEYKEARVFCDYDNRRYYKMMIDTEDGAIWSDVFIDENTWKVYHSDTIHQLDYLPGYIADIEKGYIDDAIRLLKKAGWEITD